MTANQINLEAQTYTFSANTYADKSHYKLKMRRGHVFPTTKAQAQYFISNGICLDVLNSADVVIVEALLNKHGYVGEYKHTRSGSWVRLQNNGDLHKALKAEYSI